MIEGGTFPRIAAWVLLLLSTSWSQDTPLTPEERAWLEKHPVVRVGPAPNFPPVEFFDESGRYKGIAADYAELLEERLGIRFEVVRLEDWAAVLAATKRREIDVWMEAARTPDREAYMRFTAPYLMLPAVIIVRDNTLGALSLDDLEGLRVALVS